MPYPMYQPTNPYYYGTPQMYQPQQMQPQPQQMTSTGIIWVSGQAEAEGYPIAPNSAVALWDRNQSCIYIKTADPTGRASLRILDTAERGATQASNSASGAENAIQGNLEALTAMVKEVYEIVKGGKHDD